MKNLVLKTLSGLFGITALIGVALTCVLPNPVTVLDICFVLLIASLICRVLSKC